MTEMDEPTESGGTRAEAGVRGDARRVARALGIAAAALSVPALTVAVGAAVAFVALAAVAGSAIGGDSSVVAWVLLVLAVAGLVLDLVFVLRVRATVRAARDVEALAADLVALVDLRAVATATLADLAELTAHVGGLRAVSRAGALWRILRRMDVGEHTSQFERAKWLVPPEVGTTWLCAQFMTWGGLVAWLLLPISGGARALGWL